MPKSKQPDTQGQSSPAPMPLSFIVCPNGDCADFNRFGAGNLSVVERMDKGNAIRACPEA
jgi:hypothetical protein